jgi:mono/diheme cytochrome c family protein
MTRPKPALLACALAVTGLLAACGQEIEVASDEPESVQRGAELFYERCGGCHTFDAAASQGSKPERQVSGGERTNGPNFNVRRVARDDALFAIRNGGFSGAIMPANVVVGDDAQAVADFVAKYSGRKGADE